MSYMRVVRGNVRSEFFRGVRRKGLEIGLHY